jgi:hypothetical protein
MPRPAHRDNDQHRLLFVKLKHIGDALILTPTLVAGWLDCPKQHTAAFPPPSEIMLAHQPGKVFAAAREIMRAPVPDQAG